MIEDFTCYLGKPWIAGASGPDAFDCWGLLVDIYRKHLGKTLLSHSDVDRDDFISIYLGTNEEFSKRWDSLENPIHLCAVGLSKLPKKIFHVGCYLAIDEGYIIHSQRNVGCSIEPVSKIKLNWKYISYYGLRSTN